jgi:hypothetical protein
MMLAKACAIGAVYVFEGAPRELARGKRDAKRASPPHSVDDRRTDYWLQHSVDQFYGVGDDFLEFWADSPAQARESLLKARANPHFRQSRPPEITELRTAVGETISKVRTLAYRRPQGDLDLSDNDVLELTMASGRAIRLRGDGSGQWLQLFFDEWRDPFAGPQPAENEEYLRHHGRWEAFDLTTVDLWSELAGSQVSAVEYVEGYAGRPSGATLTVGAHVVTVQVAFDQTTVSLDGRPAAEWLVHFG